MASPFPSAPEQIIPTPSNGGPEPHQPFSSQASLHASYLGIHDMTNAMDLSIPPNALRALAQGHASGRLPMPPNLYAGLPAGTPESVAPGISTTVGSYSQPEPTMFRSVSTSAHFLGVVVAEPITQSPATTLDQPSRDKVRARRAPRKGKSKARTIVSRGPAHTTVTSYRGDCTQSAPTNKTTSATQGASSQGEATPPMAFAGSSDVVKSTMRPFPWATATSEEIVSRLPELNNIPLTLIDVVLLQLRAFIEEHERSIGNNSPATGHGQKLPAEMPEALRVARPAGPSTQVARAESSPMLERSEPTFLMLEQSCGLDQPPATLPTCGGFNSLSQPRSDSENAEPQLIVEEPPSIALQGLLDIDRIWGMDVCQPESSLAQTLLVGEVIERSPWARSEVLNTPSDVGYDVDLSGAGIEAFGQVDLSALLDGWEGFADM